MTHPLITQDHIDTFQRDGVVMIKGLFSEHVEALQAGAISTALPFTIILLDDDFVIS